jgi:hypothetical protein
MKTTDHASLFATQASAAYGVGGEEFEAIPADELKTRNVYVAELPLEFTEQHLAEMMQQFGPVSKCRIFNSTRKVLHTGRAYGFCLFKEPKDAARAITGLDGLEIDGRSIQVRLSDNGIVKAPPPKPVKKTPPPPSSAKAPTLLRRPIPAPLRTLEAPHVVYSAHEPVALGRAPPQHHTLPIVSYAPAGAAPPSYGAPPPFIAPPGGYLPVAPPHSGYHPHHMPSAPTHHHHHHLPASTPMTTIWVALPVDGPQQQQHMHQQPQPPAYLDMNLYGRQRSL